MKCSWRSPWMWTIVILLTACDRRPSENLTGSAAVDAQAAVNCPAQTPEDRRFDLNASPYLPEIFDFTAHALTATTDTVTVATPHYNLVFCRATAAWVILPPSEAAEAQADLAEEFLDETATPAFQVLSVGGTTYEYRVLLAPNPRPSYENPPNQVIFELMPPNATAAIALDLYSLEQLRDTGIGYELGVPEVKAALSVGDALFFAVSSEQGEGFSGLTTLIRYEPATQRLELLQPPEIMGEQITALTATTDGEKITLWMGTKYSVEGSGLIPAKGLVAYTFTAADWKNGAIAIHSIHNSPLIGAVPTQLYAEEESLWAATGNGICQIQWQRITDWNAWQCWRYALEVELPTAGLPFYRSLLATVPQTTLTPTEGQKTAEVLWWSNVVPFGIMDEEPRKGRFEIAYPTGFNATMPEGAFKWDDDTRTTPTPDWDDKVYWLGEEWHWEGEKFVRGFDEVAANAVGLGPYGISEQGYNAEGIQDTNVLRGDLKLLSLTAEETQIQYFSGWVDDDLIQPYFVVVPSQKKPVTTPNPLKAIAPNLKTLE